VDNGQSGAAGDVAYPADYSSSPGGYGIAPDGYSSSPGGYIGTQCGFGGSITAEVKN